MTIDDWTPTEEVYNALYNHRFVKAFRYAKEDDDIPEHVIEIIKALANMIGNIGWGYGELETIVDAALMYLGIDSTDSEMEPL